MKKLLSTLSILFLTCTLVACATNRLANTNTPQSVAVRAVEAMHKGDADTLFKLMHMPEKLKKKKGAERFWSSRLKSVATLLKIQTDKKGGIANVRTDSVGYSNNQKWARVQVTIKFKNGITETPLILLRFINDRWLVIMDNPELIDF